MFNSSFMSDYSNFTTEEIEIHVRTYRSLLKSAGNLKIDTIIDSHKNLNSILHPQADSDTIDMSAFIYVLLRLPSCMSKVKNIILGQSYSVFRKHGFKRLSHWKEVSAPGRRRKMYFDDKDTLTVYIASVTDVDDLITLLTAFQIEWNKFHKKLSQSENPQKEAEKILDREDIAKIKNIWGDEYVKFLTALKGKKIDFSVRLLAGSYVEYAKSTQHWWSYISSKFKNLEITRRPVYFVSSNTHSLVNLLTRYALTSQNKLTDYLYKSQDKNLVKIWEEIKAGQNRYHKEYFLYYLSKKYAKIHKEFEGQKLLFAKTIGIHNLPAFHYLDIDAQIIELNKLPDKKLSQSDSLIINIDYPLGWAAYQVLTEIGQNVEEVRGVYIMGKAATLNGQIGDVIIPTNVFDQHTKNTYAVNNCFTADDFSKYFTTGSVLGNQKTVCTKGTFLESEKLIKKWFEEGFTTIEMETGPYLNAVYEFVYYNRYVENQFINLTNTPFELGIVHYASDTPYSKAKNLGVRNLSYEGVEPTYAATQAILSKIIQREQTFNR